MIAEAVDLLARGELNELHARGWWPHDVKLLHFVLSEYGERLISPLPEEAFDSATLYEIGADADAVDTNIYLWTAAGESDLAVKLRLWSEPPRIQITAVDVM